MRREGLGPSQGPGGYLEGAESASVGEAGVSCSFRRCSGPDWVLQVEALRTRVLSGGMKTGVGCGDRGSGLPSWETGGVDTLSQGGRKRGMAEWQGNDLSSLTDSRQSQNSWPDHSAPQIPSSWE